MKTADLVAGVQTDALVALARGWERYTRNQTCSWNKNGANSSLIDGTRVRCRDYSPSTNPAQWAELIIGFGIWISSNDVVITMVHYASICPHVDGAIQEGPTLGLAICKAVIAAKWGDEIPDEMWEKVDG